MVNASNLSEKRFEFGQNWSEYLAHLDEPKILEAELSLKNMLEVNSLEGKTFLDIGSGSGLFSLAARRLGAHVFSFDLDPKSVACTKSLKSTFFRNDPNWNIVSGSALNIEFLKSLGTFDIVYSWGVLHHTGDMWRALDNATISVAKNGQLFIAIYNDQGWKSKLWWYIKFIYNSLNASGKKIYSMLIFFLTYVVYFCKSILKGDVFAPIRNWKTHTKTRGMNPWYDWIDWVGGFPFEVASIEQLEEFYKSRKFDLVKVKKTTSLGCNQLVFRKSM